MAQGDGSCSQDTWFFSPPCHREKCALMPGAPLPSLLFLVLFISSSFFCLIFFFFFCIFPTYVFTEAPAWLMGSALCVVGPLQSCLKEAVSSRGQSLTSSHRERACSLPTLLSKPCHKYPIQVSINRNTRTKSPSGVYLLDKNQVTI